MDLHPVPNDKELSQYFLDLIREDDGILDEVMDQLLDTIEETEREGQPREFAFGKLLSFLRDQNEPTLIHLCAAALWALVEHREEIGD